MYLSDETITTTQKIPKEYGFNFETGLMTGKVVEGIEAIKAWAYFAIMTARSRYYAYSDDYGSELDTLTGSINSDEYFQTETKRMISECLLVNENIISIENYTCKNNNGLLSINFTLNTEYGEGEIEIENI